MSKDSSVQSEKAPFLSRVFKPNDPSGDLTNKEIVYFSISGFGQNVISTLLTSFIMLFFTDALIIAPMTVSWIMLGARMFDALNDPIMGSIVDRTRTKWGKLRPYMLFMPIPIAILTILCFTNFGIDNDALKVTVATAIYVVWGIAYTIMDVPYWSLSSAMTLDAKKRTNMLTVSRLFCAAGAGVIQVFVPIFIGMATDPYKAYSEGSFINGVAVENLRADATSDILFWCTLICVIPAMLMLFLAFFGTHERAVTETKPQSLGHNLKQLTRNKPLLMIMIVGVLGSLRLLYTTMMIYFCKYNLADIEILGMRGEGLATLGSILIVPGGLIASVLTPYLTKKFGKKWVFIISHALCGIIAVLTTVVNGWSEAWQLVILALGFIFMGFPMGFSNILTYAMIGDTVDYLDLKTGERSEGICFSMQTLISKIGMAMTAFIGMLVLGLSNYQANVEQSPETLQNIFFCMTLITGISTLVCVIPLFFYKFNEREQKLAVEILEKRNAARDKNGFYERGGNFDEDFKVDIIKNTVTYPTYAGGRTISMTRDELVNFDFALPEDLVHPSKLENNSSQDEER